VSASNYDFPPRKLTRSERRAIELAERKWATKQRKAYNALRRSMNKDPQNFGRQVPPHRSGAAAPQDWVDAGYVVPVGLMSAEPSELTTPVEEAREDLP